jgi:hypothetical protein
VVAVALAFGVWLLARDAHAVGPDRFACLRREDSIGMGTQRGIVGDHLADLGLVLVGHRVGLPAVVGREAGPSCP